MMITSSIYYAQNTLPTSGNVGVGTATPSAALEVNGETKLGAVTVCDTAKFELPVIIKDSVTIEKKLRVDQDVRIIGNTVMVDNARAKSNFTLEGTTRLQGNLRLINLADSTQTDDRLLIVRPNGQVRSFEKGGLLEFIFSDDGSSSCQIIGDDVNGNAIYTLPIWKSISGINKPNGIIYTGIECPTKVGIGIAAPTDQLHVVGSGRFTGNVAIGGAATSNQNRLVVIQNNPNNNGILVQHISASSTVSGVGIQVNISKDARKALNVHNTESEIDVFSVFEDGRIVMENNDPLTKVISIKYSQSLDVFRVMEDGKVWATEVHVRLKENFPDYVFKEGYKILTIEELQQYIKVNGHLPNMPTAEQVANEGIDLGEMNRILVKKIKELTLHIIELQKEITSIKSKIRLIEKYVN